MNNNNTTTTTTSSTNNNKIQNKINIINQQQQNNNNNNNMIKQPVTLTNNLLDSVVNGVLNVNHKRAPSESIQPISNPNIQLSKEMSNPLSFSTSSMLDPQTLTSSPIKSGSSPLHQHNSNSNSHSKLQFISTPSSPSSISSYSTANSSVSNPSTTKIHDDDDEEDEGSSEEEYEDDVSMLSLQALSLTSADMDVMRMCLTDLGDNIVLRLVVHLHADDICALARVSKHFYGLIAHNQVVWRELNAYYIRTLASGDVTFDVNLWDEELHHQSQILASTPSSPSPGGSGTQTVKEKSRSITFSSKDAKKSILDSPSSTIGKKSSSKSVLGSSTMSSHGGVNNLVSFLPTANPSSSTLSTSTGMPSMNIPIIGSVGTNHIMVLNAAMRRLTPLTSVPSTDEISEFVASCTTFPPLLLLRKLIQRYIVPREFTNSSSRLMTDIEWKRLVEIPIQLRLGKLMRRVVDCKTIEFNQSALLIVMSFIRGYLSPQSEMAKGLNLSIQKKLAFIKRPDITKLSESLLCKIFRNLDLNTIYQCLRVCQKWQSSINNGNLWEQLYIFYRKKLCQENDINIWNDVNPLSYFKEINLKLTSLTPPLSSPALYGMSATLTPPMGVSPIFTNTLPPLPSKPPSLLLPKISISLDIDNDTTTINKSTDTLNSSTLGGDTLTITPSITTPSNGITPINVTPKSISPQSSTLSFQTLTITSPPPSLLSPISSTSTTPNLIQESPDVISQSRVQFMNLNQLVEKLTCITTVTDISEVNACLATYRTFTTTPLLINKLLQRYHVPNAPSEVIISQVEWRKKVEHPIQHNVFKVLKKLVDEHFEDFGPEVVTVLKIFLKHIIVDNTSLTNYLIRAFVKKVLKSDIIIEDKSTTKSARPKSGMSTLRIMSVTSIKTGFRQVLDIMTMPAEEIARQLTLMDYEIYSKIQTSEFLNQAWVKEKTRHLAPNIRAAIDRFNMITKWVCTVILKEEKIRSRAKFMSKILKVAKCLKSLSNYHTLMAILSGLNEAPIFRLKFTFGEMKQKIQKLSTELQALMTVEGNHDTYRSDLASVDPRSPCIPYLGVFLKDITFFHEGGQQGGTGINLKQSKNVYGVLKVIRNFQKNNYVIEDNPRLRECLTNLSILPEDDLYQLSLQREPRNCKRSDLV